MMKIPKSDYKLPEDEIEGLVSQPSSAPSSPYSSPARSFSVSPQRSISSSMNSPQRARLISSDHLRKNKSLLALSAAIAIMVALLCLSRNDGKITLTGIGNVITGKQTAKESFDPTSAPTKTILNSYNDDDFNDDGAGVEPGNTSTKQNYGDYFDDDAADKTTTSHDGDTDVPSEGDSSSDKTDSDKKDDENNGNDDKEGEHNEENTKKEADSSTETGKNSVETEEETHDDHTNSHFKYTEAEYTTDILPWLNGTLSDEVRDAMIEKWGKWHFWDGDPESRPTEDYMALFPNRDCPYEEFPEMAWQADAVYVNHMLDSAGELVARAKEAIYTEYGYGPRAELDHDQLKIRMDMFKLSMIDLDDDNAVPVSTSLTQGGWTTKRSLKGLVRRLLHAMMTNDTFTIVLGGHSAAAGHGNHFLQSYMMQMYKVLEPVFNRVGVKLIVRNLAQGGLGTMQHSLGSSSIYGDNIDVLVWDSSMTEKDMNAIDLFYRQALIGGKRAPVLWGGPFELLRNLYRFADGT